MYTFMEYNSACTDIILTLKGSNYNGNQNIIKRSKKQFVFKTERTEKALIGSTFGFIIKVKRTTQSKQTSSAPKRDTFTYSSPTAKQTAPKTSTAKTSTASKSSTAKHTVSKNSTAKTSTISNTQAKTSNAKTNTVAKTSSTKTVTKAKSTPTASKTKRDSFTSSSKTEKSNNISKSQKQKNKYNTYNGYGPFKLELYEKDKDRKNLKTYHVPYCDNKVEITKGKVTFLKPDSESKFGYVEYNGEKYAVQYNELEEGKQAMFDVYTEVKHLQVPNSGLKFDWLSGFAATSLEEVPSRSFKDKAGNILQSNSKNFKNDEIALDNHSNESVLANIGLNSLSFIQKGLKRDNYDVILMKNNSDKKIAAITYSQDYLNVGNDGIIEHCTSPLKLLAVDKNGKLYDINNYGGKKSSLGKQK